MKVMMMKSKLGSTYTKTNMRQQTLDNGHKIVQDIITGNDIHNNYICLRENYVYFRNDLVDCWIHVDSDEANVRFKKLINESSRK